ncbi:MAG: sulfite exporter TauE/SafE family protein [Deltaproteobacteria bacterium]|nr:sulfite exporter TauE/SafE family protein [Deltaproteobacteria bacterium]
MLGLRGLLLITLGGFGAVFTALWGRDVARRRKRAAEAESEEDRHPSARPGLPSPAETAIGFGANFFDTLGIGSYATTTSVYKLFRLVPDQRIPGTLLVGHMWPTVAQAVIYVSIIEVEMTTLLLLIAASILGSWLGAGVVSAWPRRKVQIGMGFALLGAAGLMLAKALHLLPTGGETLGLHGWRMAVGLVGNFTFGALMNLGIGAYAPSLILLGFLGMDLKSIFPVMTSSCAFIMPTSSIRFIARGSYACRAALGLALGGVPGVLLAAYVVKQLPVQYLLWLVIGVATYSALAMLNSARRDKKD